MGIARYYDAGKNEAEAVLPGGIPLRDLDEEYWETLADWQKASVDASPMYRKTPPPKAKENN